MDSFEVTCGFAFIEDLWLFISTPFVWMYNGISIYMEWLGSPYYFTTNGSMEGIMEKSILSPDDGMDPANYEHSCVNNILNSGSSGNLLYR